MQRYLKDSISAASDEVIYTPKELFRSAANIGLVSDPLLWFDFHQSRNKTAHTYDAKKARDLVNVALKLPKEIHRLIDVLEQHD